MQRGCAERHACVCVVACAVASAVGGGPAPFTGPVEPVSPRIEMLDADGDGDFDIEDVRRIGLPARPYGT